MHGVTPIFDDILVFGVGKSVAEAVLDHDAKLTALFERCRAKGIELNEEKLKLRQPQVSFMGHVISETGLKADPAKIQGIQKMPPPESKQDVKRLMGMINYLQRFAPNLSDVSAPMRDLLKEDVQFLWEEDVQGRSFEQVKAVVSEAPTLKYFDPEESVEIQCDASQRGLGACLMQNGQPVAYASRSMTDAESNYAQVEKEMLAIVFGVERFEQYVYGRPVLVETDHKPLESVFKKSLLSAPKRLQRMLLRLQKFDLIVQYKKGSDMVLADTLSQAFDESVEKGDVNREDVLGIDDLRGETEKEVESINMIQYLPVTESTRVEIQMTTEADDVLRELKSTIKKGWPAIKEDTPVCIRDYFPFRDELTVQDGLIFKGERLVIPTTLRSAMLMKVHRSHIGIQGCLRRAREVLYWPNMNSDVEEFVSKCVVCNNHSMEQGKEPLICHEIPSRPWEKIAVDLFKLNGRDFLITVDYYSSFFEVDRLHAKTASEVVKMLKVHFARHGILDYVMSDNGPPFQSGTFEDFATEYGFERVTSSPGYAQSNSKVENAVKTAKQLMKKASESKNELYLALLDWRNTPTETLNSSPAQRLFGRRTKTLLPTSNQLLTPKVPEDVGEKIKLQKAKQSINYNRGTTELKELQPGDILRLQPKSGIGKNKEWLQAKVEGKVDIRSYQVRTEDGRVYRRNRRHLRQTRELMQPASEELLPVTPEDYSAPDSGTTLPQPSIPAVKQSISQQPGFPPAALGPRNESESGAQHLTVTRSGRVVRPPQRYQPS